MVPLVLVMCSGASEVSLNQDGSANHRYRAHRVDSPGDILLGAYSPDIASLRALHWGHKDIAHGEREGRNHGEKGEREGEDGELHDGLEHGRGRKGEGGERGG